MTKQADYGIVLMTCLADAPDQRVAARALSQRTQIPLPTVSKILKMLVHADLLISHRGVKGGYMLARPPAEITVVDMIEALDGPIAFTECIEDAPGTCSQEASCRLRANWQRINSAVRGAMEAISLAELTSPLTNTPTLVQIGDGRYANAGTH
ncbi:MAG: SUF system Fe-S cluster assembly regulator [Acidobacteriota bacterium]